MLPTLRIRPVFRPLTSSARTARWRWLLPLLVLLLGNAGSAWAQSVASYATARNTGVAFASISGTGTSYSGWRNALSTDDNLSVATPIGFAFAYDGTVYDQFSVSTNGYLTFNTGTSATGSGTGAYGYQNTQFSVAGGTVTTLAPLYDDLQTASNAGTLVDLSASLKYQTTGAVGSRVLTAEWINMQDFSSTSTSSFNYQVKLYEADGHIEFNYGTMTLSNSTATNTTMSYSLGINSPAGGATAANLLTQQTANTNTFSSTASDALGGSITAGLPATGSQYSFTPPATLVAAPTSLTFTNVTPTSTRVNFVDNSTNEFGFALLRSTDNITFAVIGTGASPSQAATGAGYFFTVSGLTPGTTYYYRVVSNTEGIISVPLSGSQTTTALPTSLSGVYTIDNTQPTAGTNFNNFTDAFTTVNTATIAGAVTFNVSAGQTFIENPPALTGTGTMANPIIFQKTTGTNPVVQATSGATAVIDLAGGDFFTFTGIDVAAGATGPTYGYRVRNASATDGAFNNTVQNANITLLRTTSTSGVGLIQTSNSIGGGVAATASSGVNQNNRYLNLTIRNAYSGIWLYGTSTSFADFNTEVANCAVGNPAVPGDIGNGNLATVSTAYGIRSVLQNQQSIHDNGVTNVYAATTVYGISIEQSFGTGTAAGRVFNNRVSGVRNNNTSSTSASHGIRADVATIGGPHTLNVYNNFVSNITSGYATATATATRIIRGIYVQSAGSGSGSFINVQYNSVRIDGSGSPAGSNACFEVTTSSGPVFDVRDNIFANFTTGQTTTSQGKHYTWISSSTTAIGPTGTVSDYNDLYVASGTGDGVRGYTGAQGSPVTTAASAVDRATLANWQVTPTKDVNSVAVDPLFVSPTDLHAQAAGINSLATSITGITTDIDGQTRGTGAAGSATAPDMGADEFTPPTCLAATNLGAGNITANSADITFTPAAGGSTYTITYTPQGGTTTTFTSTATGSPVTVTGLVGTTFYTVGVTTNCGGGLTSATPTVSFTTLAGCAPVTGLVASGITTTTANLTFTAGNGNTSYTVTYTPAGGTATTVSPAPTASPVALTGLTPGTAYSATVQPVCSGGGTASASTVTFTTPIVNDDPSGAIAIPVTADCSAPTSGTNVGATTTTPNGYANPGCGIAASPKDVFYTFTTAASGPTATGVQINVTGNPAGQVRVFSSAAGAAGPFTQVACSAGSTNNTVAPNFVVSGLTASTTYYIFVSGYGSSDTQGAFTLCVTSPPSCAPVTGLVASGITSNSANLTFTAGTGNTSYTVTYTPAGGAATTVSPAPTASPVALTGLTPGTAYSATVQPVCSGGGTASASTVTFTTLFPAPANDECSGAVALTSATTCAPTTGSTLGATASAGITGTCAGTADDDVFYSFVATNTSHTVTVVGNSGFDAVINLRAGACPGAQVGSCQDATASGGTETLVATGLTVGATYLVRVYSYSATPPATAATGGFTICVTNPAPVCNVPTALATNTVAQTTANVTFTAGTGNTGFTATATPQGGGTAVTSTGTASPIALTGLAPGTAYNLSLQAICSGGGTTPAVTTTFTTLPCTAPTAAFDNTNASSVCAGSGTTLTGTLTGTAPFTGQYTVNGGPAQTLSTTGNTFGIATGNLTANATYAITALADATCTATTFPAPTTVTVNPLPTFTTAQTNVSCFGGNDGSITVTAAAGTGTFEYSNNGGTSYQASNVFSGLTAGTYQVRVRNQGGAQCAAPAQAVAITQPASAVSFSTSQTNVGCFGGSTGSLTVTASGGTVGSGYQYSNNGGTSYQASNMFSGVAAGTYQVRVRDGQACVAPAQAVVITQPAAALLAAATKTDATSFGASDGTVTASGTGGTSPYQYSLNSGAFQPATPTAGSFIFTGLSAGNYSVTVRDANACTASTSITVSSPGAPVCNAPTGLTATSVTQTSANASFTAGTGNTSFTATATPATGPAVSNTGTTSPIALTGLAPNTAYTLRLQAVCAGGGSTPAVTTTFSTPAATCAAPGTPSFSAIATTSASVSFTPSSTNVAPYTVTATAGASTITVTGAASPISLTGLAPGTTYSVTVTGTCTAAAGGGNSPASAAALLTTATPPCNAPTAPSAGSVTNNSATVSFTGSGSATAYTATTSPVTTTQTLAAGATSVGFTGLAAGTVYTVSIVSNCAGGATSGAATTTFTTTSVCNAPTALAPSAITTNSATVTFTSSGSATGYTVTTSPVTTTQTLAASATSVGFTGLAAGTAYTVSIVSNCAGGATSSAATTTFTTTITPCSAPSIISISGVTQTTASVSLTPGANGGTTFTVTATPTAGAPVTATGTSPVGLTGLTAGTSYSVTATSTCNAGFSSPSSTSAATTFTTTAATPNPLIAVSQGGTGIANGGSFSGFASTQVGSTSAAVVFTITNASSTSALTLGTFVLTGPFALSGPQPTSVAANSSATFSLTFTPTGTGANPGTLTIPNNSLANSAYVINLSGQGTPAPLPNLIVMGGTQNVSGTYNNVTVTGTGLANLVGTLMVNGALVIQPGGVLSQNCQLINGLGSFEVQAGALLGICDPAGLYSTGAFGAVRVTGIRTYSTGAAYAYNNPGLAAQVTGPGLPAQVAGLGVNNPAGVTLSQAVAVAQQVTLQAGNLNTGGQLFTLLSSAAGTAVVDNGTASSIVTGTTTVQRFIDNANPIGYRHYSAPVSNTFIADLTAPGLTLLLTQTYNTSPTPGLVTPFPNVFGYNESRVNSVTSNYPVFDKGWFTPQSGDAMVVNRGYTVNAPNTALVDFVGLLNNGTQNSGTLAYSGPNAGWHLLGNPYPAPLDWNTVLPAQRLGMEPGMSVFQSSGQYGGSYRTFGNGIGASSLIVGASGYLVRVATVNGAGAVNLTNTNRLTTFGAQPAFGRGTADTRPQLQLLLRGATALDETYVYFQAGASAGHDADYDVSKPFNPSGLNVNSLAGADDLAINGLPLLSTAPVLVPLAVATPSAGSYSFEAGNVANFTGSVTLIDALANTRTVLARGTRYAFTLAGTAAPGRFTLEFRATGALATTSAQALAAQIQLFPNPTSASFRLQLPMLAGPAVVSATLLNALGQVMLSRTLSAPAGQAIDAVFDVRGLATGVYTLHLNVAGTPLVRKVVVE